MLRIAPRIVALIGPPGSGKDEAETDILAALNSHDAENRTRVLGSTRAFLARIYESRNALPEGALNDWAVKTAHRDGLGCLQRDLREETGDDAYIVRQILETMGSACVLINRPCTDGDYALLREYGAGFIYIDTPEHHRRAMLDSKEGTSFEATMSLPIERESTANITRLMDGTYTPDFFIRIPNPTYLVPDLQREVHKTIHGYMTGQRVQTIGEMQRMLAAA